MPGGRLAALARPLPARPGGARSPDGAGRCHGGRSGVAQRVRLGEVEVTTLTLGHGGTAGLLLEVAVVAVPVLSFAVLAVVAGRRAKAGEGREEAGEGREEAGEAGEAGDEGDR